MKNRKLYWNWKNKEPELDTNIVDINQYIEVGSKKNNCWWSKLSHMGKFNNVKEWAKEIGHEWFLNKNNHEFQQSWPPHTAKICPAIGNGILEKSFLVKSPTDIVFTIDPDGNWIWKGSDSIYGLNIDMHYTNQFYTEVGNPFEGYINIKFELPIYLSTNKMPIMFLHPQYHKQNYPFKVINGVIEGLYTKVFPCSINTIIKLPKDKEETYFIKEGTVLAYLWSPEKIKLEQNTKIVGSSKNTFSGKRFYPDV